MEVVIAFSESNESSHDVITRRIAIVKGLVTQPMGKRVDTECGLLDEEDAEDASVDETAEIIAPSETTDNGWENQAHEENDLEVVLVLPNDDWVFIEIRDICASNSLRVLLHEHPAEMGIEKAFADGVWVLLCVGVSMVSTVVSRPPSHRALDGSTSDCG